MIRTTRSRLLRAVLWLVPLSCAAAVEQPQSPAPVAATRISVLTGDQVIQILDETVDWYRTLGTQQQTATQPSDLLILYANRQTADKVVGLAFDIARANAELLSSEADSAKSNDSDAGSPKALRETRDSLEAQHTSIQAEIDAARGKPGMQAKVNELQGELDLVNARRNFLETMGQFLSESDAKGAGTSALKQHIDAIAASIPASGAATVPTGVSGPTAGAGTAAPAASPAPGAGLITTADDRPSGRLGLWDLTSNVFRLSERRSTIDAVDTRTAALQDTFAKTRTLPLTQLNGLLSRGDSLAQQADTANGETLKGVRDQFDTLAWVFKQTASILVPLSKEGVLLNQYRHNLSRWHDSIQGQYRDALKALGARLGALLVMLAIVFVAAELWRRAVLRYATEPRRRYQFLLLRKVTLWALVIAIVGYSSVSTLGSFVTFAGLITAGIAVAMQSVLVSVVGYFFLIGKYGIRVGDRVQIGTVTGEVIDLGLVRMHLMELGGSSALGPTGRVVAFANSIVFQASGGLFKQIPGVNLTWHEISFDLPADRDYASTKERIVAAVAAIVQEYRGELERQTREIRRTTASIGNDAEIEPRVQLQFSSTKVNVVVRYPVSLAHAAEMDERVSQTVLTTIRGAEPMRTIPV